MATKRTGLLFVVSGPSGAGKSTVLARVLSTLPDTRFSISATTREPRPGEQDGLDYFFIDVPRFERMIQDNQFLEWAKVYQHYYGTPDHFVDECLRDGQDVLLDIDVQGARQVRARRSDAIFLFLAPPSMEELEKRLRGRHTETEEKIERRLEGACHELAAIPEYDYLVVNDQVGAAVLSVQSIIEAERSRVPRTLPLWPQLGTASK